MNDRRILLNAKFKTIDASFLQRRIYLLSVFGNVENQL